MWIDGILSFRQTTWPRLVLLSVNSVDLCNAMICKKIFTVNVNDNKNLCTIQSLVRLEDVILEFGTNLNVILFEGASRGQVSF